MEPTLRAALLSWDVRPELLFVLLLAGGLYVRGWRRLRTLSAGRAYTGWRLASYLLGLTFIGLALMSPIDVLALQLFSLHMLQHVILMGWAPPLLWLARPLPVVLWGLPRPLRERGGELLAGRSPLRRLLKRAAGPGQTWLVYIMVYWGWHDPHLYNLALGHEWVHDLEHISFFGVAVLYFWHIVGAGPLIHRRLPYLLRMAYALAAVPVNMIAGVAIAFAEQPLYAFYAAMPRLWGLSLMDDQRIAGVIMWIPGSMMFVLAALVLAGRWLQQEERKPALTERDWAADEAVLAPGWRRK